MQRVFGSYSDSVVPGYKPLLIVKPVKITEGNFDETFKEAVIYHRVIKKLDVPEPGNLLKQMIGEYTSTWSNWVSVQRRFSEISNAYITQLSQWFERQFPNSPRPVKDFVGGIQILECSVEEKSDVAGYLKRTVDGQIRSFLQRPVDQFKSDLGVLHSYVKERGDALTERVVEGQDRFKGDVTILKNLETIDELFKWLIINGRAYYIHKCPLLDLPSIVMCLKCVLKCYLEETEKG